MENLPILTDKQEKFLLYYFTNNKNATDAYKKAYSPKKMNDNSICVEASRLLKHPKVALWLDYYNKNQQEVIENEVKYTVKDSFNEIDEVIKLAKKPQGKSGSLNLGAAIKGIELKGKLKGLYKEKLEVSGEKLSDILDNLSEPGTPENNAG